METDRLGMDQRLLLLSLASCFKLRARVTNQVVKPGVPFLENGCLLAYAPLFFGLEKQDWQAESSRVRQRAPERAEGLSAKVGQLG